MCPAVWGAGVEWGNGWKKFLLWDLSVSLNTASWGWSLNRAAVAGVEPVNVSLLKKSVSLNETLNGDSLLGGPGEGFLLDNFIIGYIRASTLTHRTIKAIIGTRTHITMQLTKKNWHGGAKEGSEEKLHQNGCKRILGMSITVSLCQTWKILKADSLPSHTFSTSTFAPVVLKTFAPVRYTRTA